MTYLQVAVAVPLRQTFTYSHQSQLPVGSRVWVEFGRRKMVGIVVGPANEEAQHGVKVKPLLSVIDARSVFNDELVTLAHWLWQYYHHSPGEVLHTMLPALLRKGECAEAAAVTMYQLSETGLAIAPDTLKRAPKQVACIAALRNGALSKTQLQSQFSVAVIKGLLEKGLIIEFTESYQPDAQRWVTSLAVGARPVPDKQQAIAIATINQQHQFAVSLLEGVTGSGKTEVYLQAIERVLADGKQVLILVPEIGLTPQTVARFQTRFNIPVGVLHSQLNDTERLSVWRQAKDGELGIIIGTRSAIFTPLKYPGMIIVDEEHDDSFKQQDGLRYHARDVAVMRAKYANIPLVLGSATPSFESLNNALQGKFHHLKLAQRAAGAADTHKQLLDIRDQPIEFGIARGIQDIIRSHLVRGNQVLVFVNRRGFAPALICHHCGHTEMCQRCDKPYTVHKADHYLQCHHCGNRRKLPMHCTACGSADIVTSGVGTEQVESGLATLFPEVKQVRIDSDSVRGKNKLQRLLDAINDRQYQLLVGTQILSKGHHFPHVTLVVILDSDGALFSADFRAAEKLGQLVTQLAGRAGRAAKAGEMWLQTHNPDHPLLQDLIHNGYAHFARHALTERKAAGLPPFASQFVLRAESVNAGMAHAFLQQCRDVLSARDASQQLHVIGPIPGLIEKRQGRYRFLLIASHSKRGILHQALRLALPEFSALKLSDKLRWSVDVDPQDFS